MRSTIINLNIFFIFKLETALVADALTHVEKAMKTIQGQDDETENINVEDFIEPPSLCLKDSKADYEEVAWPLGEQLRQILINVIQNFIPYFIFIYRYTF
jgi:hypothetical protein